MRNAAVMLAKIWYYLGQDSKLLGYADEGTSKNRRGGEGMEANLE